MKAPVYLLLFLLPLGLVAQIQARWMWRQDKKTSDQISHLELLNDPSNPVLVSLGTSVNPPAPGGSSSPSDTWLNWTDTAGAALAAWQIQRSTGWITSDPSGILHLMTVIRDSVKIGPLPWMHRQTTSPDSVELVIYRFDAQRNLLGDVRFSYSENAFISPYKFKYDADRSRYLFTALLGHAGYSVFVPVNFSYGSSSFTLPNTGPYYYGLFQLGLTGDRQKVLAVECPLPVKVVLGDFHWDEEGNIFGMGRFSETFTLSGTSYAPSSANHLDLLVYRLDTALQVQMVNTYAASQTGTLDYTLVYDTVSDQVLASGTYGREALFPSDTVLWGHPGAAANTYLVALNPTNLAVINLALFRPSDTTQGGLPFVHLRDFTVDDTGAIWGVGNTTVEYSRLGDAVLFDSLHANANQEIESFIFRMDGNLSLKEVQYSTDNAQNPLELITPIHHAGVAYGCGTLLQSGNWQGVTGTAVNGTDRVIYKFRRLEPVSGIAVEEPLRDLTRVYPNPAPGEFILDLAAFADRVDIFSMDGRCFLSREKLEPGNHRLELPAGNYVLVIRSASEVRHHQLIIL